MAPEIEIYKVIRLLARYHVRFQRSELFFELSQCFGMMSVRNAEPFAAKNRQKAR
jgi:hypothetical protein